MPHATRWRCLGCGRELGVIVRGRLEVDGLRVVADARRVLVTCPDCRAERAWEALRSA